MISLMVSFALLAASMEIHSILVENPDVEVELLGTFTYEDVSSDNAQIIAIEQKNLRLTQEVEWLDGGAWRTTWSVPLEAIQLESILPLKQFSEQVPGVQLATQRHDITVTETRGRRKETSKTYALFIRTRSTADAVRCAVLLDRLARLHGARP